MVNRLGFRYPELHAGCTGCAACLLVCPDFVFEVFRYETPVEHTVSEDE
jgi:2-oxoglutarate ferredoxin oxidoreductase subunit delta